MGNRATIATKNKDLMVYVHWNGGRDSIEGFLKFCELKGFRAPESDSYGWARLVQVIANFFGADGLSIGISKFNAGTCEGCDNGLYIIEKWQIVGREFFEGEEQNEYNFNDFLKELNNAQPENMRLEKI